MDTSFLPNSFFRKMAKNIPANPSFTGTSREKNSSSQPSGTRTLSRFSGDAR